MTIYKQYIENIFEEKIGRNGLTTARFNEIVKIIQSKFHELDAQKLQLFNFPLIKSQLNLVEEKTKEMQAKCKKLYVLGTGGATLCPQAICKIKYNIQEKINFVDNVDPETFRNIADNIKMQESCILITSKSGSTIETITQLLFFINLYKKNGLEGEISNRFYIITDTSYENNIIANIAKKLDIEIIEHEKVGGRFSIFSTIAMIPALFAEMNIKQFIEGAEKTYTETKEKGLESFAIQGTAINHLITEKNISSVSFMPYSDKLAGFTEWLAQIWAESLGKTDYATTPLKARGTLDQHSQLQLYLGGKKDKFFNIITVKQQASPSNNIFDVNLLGNNLEFLQEKDISDIARASAISTYENFGANNIPARHIELDTLDELTLGALTMQFVLETILLAYFWNINAFDQPAVEQGKKLAVKLLQNK